MCVSPSPSGAASPSTKGLTADNPPFQACTSALEGSQFYEHSKTELWNTTIIVGPPPFHPPPRSPSLTASAELDPQSPDLRVGAAWRAASLQVRRQQHDHPAPGAVVGAEPRAPRDRIDGHEHGR